MKILYIAREPNEAQAATTAFRALAPNVAVAWASRFDDGAQWIDNNRDVAGLIVEADVEHQGGASFLKHVRRLGLTAPIVVVAPEEASPPYEWLKAGADDYIVKSRTLFDDLPDMVGRAIARAHRPVTAAPKRPLRLLYIGDAALARECLGSPQSSIEIIEAVPGPDGTFQSTTSQLSGAGAPPSFDVLLVEHDHPGVDVFSMLKDLAARNVHLPVIVVVEWDEELAIPALKMGASDYVVKARDPLRALLFKLGRGHVQRELGNTGDAQQHLNDATEPHSGNGSRLKQEGAGRTELEQKLKAAEAALKEAERRRAGDIATFNARLAQEQAQFESDLAAATSARDAVDRKLADAQAALERAERARASDAAALADQLAQRRQAFTASLAEVVSSRDVLEQRLNEAVLALERAEQDRNAEVSAAARLARREAELEARLNQEISNREVAEQNTAGARQKLEEAEAALERAAGRHASEATTTAAQLVERQAQHESELAQAAAIREGLEQQLADASAALERAEQQRSWEAAAHADLDQRSAELGTRLGYAIRARDTLKRQLSEAELAIERARQDHASAAHAVERLTSRETELTAQLAEASAARTRLDRQLAELETTRKEADERGARDLLGATQCQEDLEARLEREIQQSHTLAEELRVAEEALRDAERRHAAAATTASRQLSESQASYDARLARAVAAWDMAIEQLSEAGQAVDQARQDRISAAAAVERLTAREAELTALLADARQAHTTAADAVARLTSRKGELTTQLAEATARGDALDRRLAETEAARREADERATRERQTAAQRQADLEAQLARLDTRLDELVHKGRALADQLQLAEAARRFEAERHATAMNTVAAELAEHQARFGAERTQAAGAQDALRQQLSETEAALGEARQAHASAAAELAEHQARSGVERTQAAAAQETLRQQLSQTEVALGEARQAHATAAGVVESLTDRGAELTAQLAEVRRAHASDADAVARLTSRKGELTTQLAEATTRGDALDRRLAETEAARREADERATRERQAATQRQAVLEAQLAQLDTRLDEEAHKSRALADQLQFAEAALRFEEERYATAMNTAAAELAEHQARFGVERTQAAAAQETLRERLSETEAALGEARQAHTTAADAVARLTSREAELTTQLASARQAHTTTAAELAEHQARFGVERTQAAAAQETLRQQLSETEVALGEARRAHASAAGAVERLTDQGAELTAQLAEVRRAHASAADAVARLTSREAELTSQLAETTVSHDALDRRLAETEAAGQEADERATRERVAATQRQADLEAQLAQLDTGLEEEGHKRRALADQLQLAEAALRFEEERHASAMNTAAAELAEHQARFGAERTQVAEAQEALRQQLSETEAALGEARRAHASAAGVVERLTDRGAELTAQLAEVRRAHATAADAVARLTSREAELTTQLAETTTSRDALDRRLAETEAARREADERATRERVAATQRQADLEARLAQLHTGLEEEGHKRRALADQLQFAEAALRFEEERHASAMNTAAAELAQHQARLGVERTQAAAAQETLRQRLSETEAALGEARRAHASAAGVVERLTDRGAELTAQLAEVRRAHATAADAVARLTSREAELTTQLASARQAHTTTAAELAEHQARFGVERTQAAAAQETLRRQLSETEAALAEVRRAHATAADAVARLTSREAELTTQLAETTTSRDALDRRLAETKAAGREADERATRERLDAAQRQANLERAIEIAEADGRRLATELDQIQLQLQQVRRDSQQELEGLTVEHANVLAEFDALVTERDRQLKTQVARHSTSQQAAKRAVARLKDGFRVAMAASHREIEQLQSELETTIQELGATRAQRETLRVEADRVPRLQNQLGESQAEIRRQFDQNPLAMCRCDRAGALTSTNPAFRALIGHEGADALRGVDLATAVLESSGDLSSLIQRCLATGTTGSVESSWRRKDGARLNVRVSAIATSDGIEIAAEDLTNVRALQTRLNQSQRMEAVGRLASEVAATCGKLLSDVSQDGQRWLAALESHTLLHHQGGMLFGEVTRAASFLRQLWVYGDEQTSVREPVDLTKVLRDLEPVLKRVAGEQIELVLPKTSSGTSYPLNVDVKAERVERLLVNIASYGRERMPFGGRLTIELSSAVVGRKFIAKYPNVREGPHVLITVTEVRQAMRSGGPMGLRGETAGAPHVRSAFEKPGVDLGALQALIRECGGHLWMKVEPPGNMVAKIHLPLRAPDDSARSRVPATGASGAMGRWFQH